MTFRDGSDVQVVQHGKGVQFSVDSEARERRGRAWRRGELHELRWHCELEAVTPVLPGRPKDVKEDRNNEG